MVTGTLRALIGQTPKEYFEEIELTRTAVRRMI
jgi:hypothetical protein